MSNNTEHLSLQEAYLAMYEFLIELYQRTHSEELGAILGDLSLLKDGTTADPAAWMEWVRCVAKVRGGGVDANLSLIPPS